MHFMSEPIKMQVVNGHQVRLESKFSRFHYKDVTGIRFPFQMMNALKCKCQSR